MGCRVHVFVAVVGCASGFLAHREAGVIGVQIKPFCTPYTCYRLLRPKRAEPIYSLFLILFSAFMSRLVSSGGIPLSVF